MKILGNQVSLVPYIRNCAVALFPNGRQTLADADFLDLSVDSNGLPLIKFNQSANKFTVSIVKVNDYEFNIIVSKYYPPSSAIASILTDSNGVRYLQAAGADYSYTKYIKKPFIYDDEAKKMMIDNSMYWLGISICNGLNNLTLQALGLSGQGKKIEGHVEYIKQLDGTIITTKDFCTKK